MNIKTGFNNFVSWFVSGKTPDAEQSVIQPPVVEAKDRPFEFNYNPYQYRSNSYRAAVVVSSMLQDARNKVCIFDRNLQDLLNVNPRETRRQQSF